MNITILDNREIIIKTSDAFGTQNENKATVFNFSFPESLINANKKIVFITDDGVYWDLITNNSYKITNAVTKYKTVSAYVWLVDVEKDIDFRSKSWKITFNKNEEPDDVVPTEEEISGFDTMIAQLNTAIAEVDNIDIDAEKVGDTATVTITNKQGTQKSVEIKDGSDYIITEDDYREIANIVEADLPENYYNKTETNNLLDGKVDKETGKTLIETSKIEKLDGIETGAEVNVVEDIKVNGTSLEVEEKAVNIPVPTDLKDLTDDSTHRLVSDSEKTTWNNKANMSDIPDVSGFITKDVNNLTNYTLKTATGSLIDLEINSSNYVVSLSLKDIDGNVISTDTIDLPLESVVVGGSYDATNKKIVLTLENGNTVDIPIGDLIAGLQTEITSQNKLASDLVDDSNSGNKFVNTSEKQAWNSKYDKPAGGIPKTDLASSVGASLDKADSAIQEADLADYVKNTDYATVQKGGVVKIGSGSGTDILNGVLRANEYGYNVYPNVSRNAFISKGTLENVIAGKNLEIANNKVTEIDENSTDTEYPSAKAVYEENKLLKDQIPIGTAEGTNVQITDSSNLPIEDGVIKGYTSQETREGYQLINTSLTKLKELNTAGTWNNNVYSRSGMTFTINTLEDDTIESIVVNGTSSSAIGDFQLERNVTLEAGNYTISGCPSGGSISTYYISIALIGSTTYLIDIGSTQSKAIADTTSNLTTRIFIANGVTLNNAVFKPMVTSGSTVKPYEPYTGGQASPNPAYPQLIHTVTGDCEVEVVSKNLFDKDNAIDGYRLGSDGTIFPNSGYSVTDFIKVKPSTNFYRNRAINIMEAVCLYDKDKNFISRLLDGNAFTTTENTYYIKTDVGNTYLNTTQLEQGSTATTYTPHAHQTFPISLGTIELCKIGNYQDCLFKNVRTLRSGRANPLFNADLDEGDWYKHSEIGNADLGIDSVSVVPVNYSENSRTQGLFQINGIPNILPNNSYNITPNDTLSNSYINGYVYNYLGDGRNPIDKTMSRYTNAIYIQNSSFSGYTNEQVKTALEGTILYYPLATPTYTKITDTTLIAQLEAYYNSSTYRNVTNIITAGDDLAPIASIVYKKDLTTLFSRLDSLEARVDLLE